MEELQVGGKVTLLGISNVTAEQLEALLQDCKNAPAFVQNRCYARTGWDANVRNVCRKHGIVYQGFSLLTANRREMEHEALRENLACFEFELSPRQLEAIERIGVK